MPLPAAELLEILRDAHPTLSRKQLWRWRERGLHVDEIPRLVEELAEQDRPGRIFEVLSRPGVSERMQRRIDQAKRLHAVRHAQL